MKSTILELLVSLAEAPLRTCRSLHSCCLCKGDIALGQKYRDRGYGRRAHLGCVTDAANRLADAINAYAPDDSIIERVIEKARTRSV